MSTPDDLQQSRCEPCEGGVPPFTARQVAEHLAAVPRWSSEGEAIHRDFQFKDFQAALAFLNRIADLAEEQGHHPDLLLHGWNKLRVTLSTHAIGGLSRNDFILAAHVDRLPLSPS